MEKILIEWFEGMRSANLPINGVLLKKKAIRVATRLRIENFKGSIGWLDRFKKCHGLEYKVFVAKVLVLMKELLTTGGV
jgi:centromere protein B